MHPIKSSFYISKMELREHDIYSEEECVKCCICEAKLLPSEVDMHSNKCNIHNILSHKSLISQCNHRISNISALIKEQSYIQSIHKIIQLSEDAVKCTDYKLLTQLNTLRSRLSMVYKNNQLLLQLEDAFKNKLLLLGGDLKKEPVDPVRSKLKSYFMIMCSHIKTKLNVCDDGTWVDSNKLFNYAYENRIPCREWMAFIRMQLKEYALKWTDSNCLQLRASLTRSVIINEKENICTMKWL